MAPAPTVTEKKAWLEASRKLSTVSFEKSGISRKRSRFHRNQVIEQCVDAEYARAERPNLHIVARAHDRVHVYELYRAGANDIVREMFDSSLRAGRYVLENMEFSPFEASEMERAFYRHDRRTLRELAELWQPGVPVTENAAYVERARARNTELETALVRALDDPERAEHAAESDRHASDVALSYAARKAAAEGRGGA